MINMRGSGNVRIVVLNSPKIVTPILRKIFGISKTDDTRAKKT
jgi:hypothetical protein